MEATVAVRLNPFKGAVGPEGTQVPWSKWGRVLSRRPVFTLDPLLHAGCYYVQDSSAQFVGHRLRELLPRYAEKGLRVLDLCAAPGGKTTDLACSLRESLGSDFQLVSNEVMHSRQGALLDNVALWGDPQVSVTGVDPGAFASLEGWFDIIVADVPCSGEGMFRKDPSAEAQWSPELVQACAARQRRILSSVWPSLRSGGLLIYSTCTYESAENDDNLEWIASELGGEIIAPEEEFSEFGVALTPHGHILRAGVSLGEGQWVGALVKTSEQRRDRGADLKKLHPLWPARDRGQQKGTVWIPDPNYALSLDFDPSSFPGIEVDRQTALRFLHRDTLSFPDASLGYNVIKYQGHPLGFVKNIGTRCNNLHPKGRRIMMNI